MAAAAPVLAALITTAATVHSSGEQRKEANRGRQHQDKLRRQQEQVLKTKEEQDQVKAQQEAERARRKLLGSSSDGRQSTILTSPLGVQDAGGNPYKTLLGT